MDTLNKHISFCTQPWSNLFLKATGRIQPCCMNSTHLGNILENSIEEAWNGETMQNIRKFILEKKYAEAGCFSDCSMIKELEKTTVQITPTEWKMSYGQNKKFDHNIDQYGDSIINKKLVVTNTPITLDIQPNESCNMSCIMCHQKHDSKDKITPEFLTKLFHDNENIYSARFQGGEVFLYPKFTQFLIDLKQKFLPHQRLSVITNASQLSPNELDELVEGETPVHFIISMDSVNEETYAHIRQTKDFKKVMRSLEYLSKKQIEKNTTFLIWNFVVMKSNFYQIKEAIKVASLLDVEIFFQTIFGPYPEENIFRYSTLKDPKHDEYIDECIQIGLELNAKVSNLNTIKEMLKINESPCPNT